MSRDWDRHLSWLLPLRRGNPVRQALVSSTATFWDTVIICALTGLVIVSSIIAYPDITFHDGAH